MNIYTSLRSKDSAVVWAILAVIITIFLVGFFIWYSSYIRTLSMNEPSTPAITSKTGTTKASSSAPHVISASHTLATPYSASYPTELIVEPVANEKSMTMSTGDGTAQTVMTYDSTHTASQVLTLYTNALTSNGWAVLRSGSSTSMVASLQASKGPTTVELAISGEAVQEKGSHVSVTVHAKQ